VLVVDVRQVVSAASRRSGHTVLVTGQVGPGGRTPVALQILRASGWATVASTLTDSAGAARFVRTLAPGTRVRLHAPARPGLLAGVSVARLT
jgi:hypothetical protein